MNKHQKPQLEKKKQLPTTCFVKGLTSEVWCDEEKGWAKESEGETNCSFGLDEGARPRGKARRAYRCQGKKFKFNLKFLLSVVDYELFYMPEQNHMMSLRM